MRWEKSIGSLPRCLQQLVLGWTKARSTDFNQGLPSRWQAPTYLSHHLPPPKVCMSRKLGHKRNSQDLMRHADKEYGFLSGDLIAVPNAHPPWVQF